VFAGERPFRSELLEPLSAFSNLLAAGRLPHAFARLNFGDAYGALGDVLASKGAGRWRFAPDVGKRTAARLGLDRMGRGLDRLRRENQRGWDQHARVNRAFILSAMERARATDVALVVGGCRAYDVPLGEIARRFARVIVVDVCDELDTWEGIARAVSDPASRGRVSVERFDLTGAYGPFVAEVDAIVARTTTEGDAAREVSEFVSAYDVPASAFRLCRADIEPDFVVSSLVLTQLGLPFRSFVARAFRERGILEPSLAAFACRLEQQHIDALLRIPKLAVLTSDVSEAAVTLGPHGHVLRVGEPRTQLSVEGLSDRIPSAHRPVAHDAWDWLRIVPKRQGAPGASMSVEGLVFERPG
jgi:hypothetical protein